MKKLLLAVLLLYPATAWAGPFLVCDPQTNVETYVITVDSNDPLECVAQDLGNGNVRMHYDLQGLSVGPHHIEVRAKNLWGQSESVPFDCTKSLPAKPSTMVLEP